MVKPKNLIVFEFQLLFELLGIQSGANLTISSWINIWLYPKCNKWYFGYSQMLILLYTVTLDTVKLTSDCIQQFKQKLKLEHKPRFKRHTKVNLKTS